MKGMRIGVYASIIASEKGYERNVSGHIQVPLHTVRLLRDAGHEVHLITNQFGSRHTLPDCMPEGIPIHYVVDARRRPDLLRGGRPREGIRPFRLLRQLGQIRRTIHRERLEVVHFFGYQRTAMLGGLLRLTGLRAPVVATLVGGKLPTALSRPARLLLGRVSAILTATSYASDQCARLGLAARIVRHGIVRDLTEELGDAPVGPRRRVLFWRDPTVHNGADVCLRAFDALAPEFPDVSFDFAIRPAWDEIDGLDDLADRHENVHVYRFPYEDGISIPRLMAESLVVVLPFRDLSVDPQLAIAESLAAGVPVITTDVRSSPELVQPGRSGTLVPVGEVEPVIAALRDMLADPESTLGLGRQARSEFLTTWSWRTYVADLERVYAEVTGAAGAPRAAQGAPP